MKLRLLALALVILLLAAPVALAANPHFVSVTASVTSGGSLEVKFKEAGLGANQSIQYLMRANSTATWGCTDKQGDPPVNRATAYAIPVQKWDAFKSDKNGNISATMSLSAPKPAGWSCSGGYPNAVLVSVTYGAPNRLSGPALMDYTNGLLVTLADQSAVYYP